MTNIWNTNKNNPLKKDYIFNQEYEIQANILLTLCVLKDQKDPEKSVALQTNWLEKTVY